MSLARKAINFDLSTNELKKHFKNTAEAYNQIKDFMLRNSFEHRQYSGYVSKEPLEDYEVTDLATKLKNQFSWLYPCTQKFDVTDIGEQHDLKGLFANDLSQQIQTPYTKDTIDKQNATNFAKSKINKESPSNDIER